MRVLVAHSPKIYEVEYELLEGLWGRLLEVDVSTQTRELCTLNELQKMPFLHGGFYDSHLHLGAVGFQQDRADLSSVKTPEDLQNLMEPFLKGATKKFFYGIKWSELDREFFPKITEEIPVLLERVCGHAAYVNQKLLDFIGVAKKAGVFKEHEFWEILAQLPQPSLVEIENAYLIAQKICLDLGIVAVSDMAQDDLEVRVLKSMCTKGLLEMDVVGVLDAHKALEQIERGPGLVNSSENSKYLGRKAIYQTPYWKKFLDGSFGSRTAWLTESYLDDPRNLGQSLEQSLNNLLQESLKALEKGFALSFHAIGDAAVDQILWLSESLLGDSRFTQRKHRIEHAQLLRDDQVTKLSKLGMWELYIQPGHAFDDEIFIGNRLGKKRVQEQSYRLKSLVSEGLKIYLGSDAPISGMNPQKIMSAACNLKNLKERLNFDEALSRYSLAPQMRIGSLVCLQHQLQ